MRPSVHHRHPIGERQRLDLIVGDEQSGDADLPDQRGKLPPHAVAQPRVEIRQGLVEQKQARPPHDRARQRHPLLLSAGEPGRRPARHGLHPDEREHVHDPLLDFRPRLRAGARLRADRRRCRRRRDAARSHRTGTPFRSSVGARERRYPDPRPRGRRSRSSLARRARARRRSAGSWSCRNRWDRAARSIAPAPPKSSRRRPP